jgi:class 3 adenylate cyclase
MSDELSYYRSRLDELTGQVIRADSIVSRAKRELGQRRKALAILSDLQRTVRADMPPAEVARLALTAASTALKMDRTVLFEVTQGGLAATTSLGYPSAEDPLGAAVRLPIPDALRQESGSLLITATSPASELIESLRIAARMPYFVAVPVLAGKTLHGIIVSGRLREQKPFFPPLDDGDLATWQATAGFLGSAILNGQLFAKTKRMADSFLRFVPQEFLDLLGRDEVADVALGDQTTLTLSILFSDIRGFTTLSEKMTPDETFRFVNGYLAHAGPVIRKNGGFIDKYIGDAIMALFPGSPADALRAGIELQSAAASFNAVSGLPSRIAVGVGVHTGQVMMGTTGFEDRLDCTVIADAVNLASRLESLTKHYGASLITSGDSLAQLPSPPEHRLIDRVKVKGKSQPVELYDVFSADPEPTRTLKRQTLPIFAAALTAYTAGDLHAAHDLLTRVLTAHPSDTAANLLLDRITSFLSTGLPNGWTGTVALESK